MKKVIVFMLCILMLMPDIMGICAAQAVSRDIGEVYATDDQKAADRETSTRSGETYEGDYVLAFNPTVSTSGGMSTGATTDSLRYCGAIRNVYPTGHVNAEASCFIPTAWKNKL